MRVATGVTVTLSPGLTIFGRDVAQFQVAGHLAATGTAAQPITLTSALNTGAGEWEGLLFDGGTGRLDWTTVRFAGRAKWNYGGGLFSSIAARNVVTGTLQIVHSRIEQSRGCNPNYGCFFQDYGLTVDNSHVDLVDSTITESGDNSSYGGTDAALFASGATTILTVTNSSIAHTSGDGIVLSGAPTVSVNGSQLTDNLGYALRGQFGVLTSITGTTFTGNGHGNRISMPGGTLTTSVGLQIQTNPGFGGVNSSRL